MELDCTYEYELQKLILFLFTNNGSTEKLLSFLNDHQNRYVNPFPEENDYYIWKFVNEIEDGDIEDKLSMLQTELNDLKRKVESLEFPNSNY